MTTAGCPTGNGTHPEVSVRWTCWSYCTRVSEVFWFLPLRMMAKTVRCWVIRDYSGSNLADCYLWGRRKGARAAVTPIRVTGILRFPKVTGLSNTFKFTSAIFTNNCKFLSGLGPCRVDIWYVLKYDVIFFIKYTLFPIVANKVFMTIHSLIHSFMPSFIRQYWLTKSPQPLPQPFLHTVRSSASSFNLQYPVFFLRLSVSSLILLPRLPATSILPSFFFLQ